MRDITFELEGQQYILLCNAAALFDSYDHFGDKGEILDHITGTTRQSFEATCWLLVKLAQQGELLRRYHGEDHAPMLSYEQALRCLSPLDVVHARVCIREAFSSGFDRTEAPEDEEVDLGLMEIQKKTAPGGSPAPGICTRLRLCWDCLCGRATC